ncbi:MAG: oligopeptide/dipeptide ABC transporter ATP-binding protein [Solirubrobacteraceae bacterium]|nr:ATP-binding cassette domain-containing protein [Patulibacter sp.]
MTRVLTIEHLEQRFAVPGGTLRAVDDVTLHVERGETLGLVGESGCGKSTLARTAMRLLDPKAGTIHLGDRDITRRSQRALRADRPRMQMVFQDPFGSLNPRRRIGAVLEEALAVGRVPGPERAAARDAALERVGLAPELATRLPHELSGGQRQRVGVARALATNPELLVADEPVSALDVSVQAQLVNLLGDLGRDLGLAQLFVAHDLSVVRQIADRIAVMYLGRIVESAPTTVLFDRARHPYTRALLAAVPVPDPTQRGRTRERLQGEPPSPVAPPSGCSFHPRCPRASDRCTVEQPPLWRYPDGGLTACHHPVGATADEIAAGARDDASPRAASTEAPSADVASAD